MRKVPWGKENQRENEAIKIFLDSHFLNGTKYGFKSILWCYTHVA